MAFDRNSLGIDGYSWDILWIFLGILWIFFGYLFTKHLLVQLLINVTIVLVKIFSNNVTITIIVFLEINLVEKTLDCPNMYGNCKRDINYFIICDNAMK